MVSVGQETIMPNTTTSVEDEAEIVIKCVDLRRAAKNGHWISAVNNPNIRPIFFTRKITDKHETCLHISASYKQHNFVRSLLVYVRTSPGDAALKRLLETQNSCGNTALWCAASTGDVEIARLMVQTHDSVREQTVWLPDLGTVKPVLAAISLRHKEMVEFLLDKTSIQDLTTNERHELFLGIIRMGLYEKAWQMLDVQGNAFLAVASGDSEPALHALARNPSPFVQNKVPPFRRFINFCTKASETSMAEPRGVIRIVDKLIETAMSRREDFEANISPEAVIAETLVIAAQEGNTELLIHLLQSDPDLLWKVPPQHGSIFHIAVKKRHEGIFTLIHGLGPTEKDLIAKIEVDGRNNILHLAAQPAPQSKLDQLSGAALQMQGEMFWYKTVEKIMPPSLRHSKNADGETPRVLFSENHIGLRHAGEKWMKGTANSCMIVGSIIAAGTFAAIFSLPGGFDNNSGKPLLGPLGFFGFSYCMMA